MTTRTLGVKPLRNVELTARYMHNGAYPTLEAVVRHYNHADSALRNYDPSHLPAAIRAMYHGDEDTKHKVLETLDFRVSEPLRLAADEQRQLVAFLKALTDPAARNLSSVCRPGCQAGSPCGTAGSRHTIRCFMGRDRHITGP